MLGKHVKPLLIDPKHTAGYTCALWNAVSKYSAFRPVVPTDPTITQAFDPSLAPTLLSGSSLSPDGDKSVRVLTAEAVEAVRTALARAVLPPVSQLVYDKVLFDCMSQRQSSSRPLMPTSLSPFTPLHRNSADVAAMMVTIARARQELSSVEALTEYELRLLMPHIEATAGKYRFTLMDQVRLKERIHANNRLPVPGATIAHRMYKHDSPGLPYPTEAITSLAVHSVSVPDQRYVTLHPQPPRVVLDQTIEAKVRARTANVSHKPVARTRTSRSNTVSSYKRSNSLVKPRKRTLSFRRRTSSLSRRRFDSGSSEDTQGEGGAGGSSPNKVRVVAALVVVSLVSTLSSLHWLCAEGHA